MGLRTNGEPDRVRDEGEARTDTFPDQVALCSALECPEIRNAS